MPKLQILHASDLHFATTPFFTRLIPGLPQELAQRLSLTSHNPGAADGFSRFAHKNRGQFDVIVLSGDLATAGSTSDLNAALDLVDRSTGAWSIPDPSTGRKKQTYQYVLKETGCDIALIPGNHDRYKAYPLCLPGNTDFDTVFSAYWSPSPSGTGVQYLWPKNAATQAADFVLIGADFTLQSMFSAASPFGVFAGLGHYGRGRVYATGKRERLTKLKDLTDKARAKNTDCVVIWVIHFEPLCDNSFLRLVNEKALLAAVEGKKIPLVLCGHSHRSCVRTIGNTVYSVCGTTTQHNAHDGNHLHDIVVDVDSGGQLTVRVDVYRYDPQYPGFGFVLVSKN